MGQKDLFEKNSIDEQIVIMKMLPNYDGVMNASAAIAMSNPQELRRKIDLASKEDLKVFIKWIDRKRVVGDELSEMVKEYAQSVCNSK